MYRLASSLRRNANFRWINQPCSCRWISSTPKTTPRGQLPSTPARTRFAPSPTGYLHLGSLRTALFNYLLAKATRGQFLLRIEDTDQKRTVPDAVDRLCEDLQWAGLQWDEGPKFGGPYGPYVQSERTAIYTEHANKLLKSGHAYRCFCSQERLYAIAKHNKELGIASDYDRTCTHVPIEEAEDRAAKGEKHVIRLKVPEKYPEFRDLVYGLVRNRQPKGPKALVSASYEDPILIKSDGFPTYHLANVVDDHFMKITHIIRGEEWMSSTPKHLVMYEAFGWEPPQFAHVGLLVDQNGQKLSKRNMDIDISSFRNKMGILPEALNNYLALQGWHVQQREGKDFMTMKDLIPNFNTKFTAGNAIVTLDKLWYLQNRHVAERIRLAATGDMSQLSVITDPILLALDSSEYDKDGLDRIRGTRTVKDYINQLLLLGARNYRNAADFVTRNRYLLLEAPSKEDLIDARAKCTIMLHGLPDGLEVTEQDIESGIMDGLKMLEFVGEELWNNEVIKTMIDQLLEGRVAEMLKQTDSHLAEASPGVSKALQKAWSRSVHEYIRWATSNSVAGPGSVDTLVLLGREESLRRLKLAEEVLEQSQIPLKDSGSSVDMTNS